jgi:hypothetical protein
VIPAQRVAPVLQWQLRRHRYAVVDRKPRRLSGLLGRLTAPEAPVGVDASVVDTGRAVNARETQPARQLP